MKHANLYGVTLTDNTAVTGYYSGIDQIGLMAIYDLDEDQLIYIPNHSIKFITDLEEPTDDDDGGSADQPEPMPSGDDGEAKDIPVGNEVVIKVSLQ